MVISQELYEALIEYREATKSFLDYDLVFEKTKKGSEVADGSAKECSRLMSRQSNAGHNLLYLIKDL